MDIVNKEEYSNFIYMGVVVNANPDEGPQDEYKVQVYIPQMQYEYDNVYEEYMNSSNKDSSKYKDVFPWAKSLVKDLKNGNVVFGSFINNDKGDFIILGLDAYNPKNTLVESGSIYDISGSGLIDLAMPIIIHHEVGLPVNAWPDGITDSQYGNINPNDNGSWSLGLIQWNKGRAYDLLLEIAKKGNWESYWTDKADQLFSDLKGQNTSNRSKYGQGYTITKNTPKYNSIRAMLVSENGKSTQMELAKVDTQSSITDLQQNYQIQNPAVIIFIADIMNQYGPGITQTKKAVSDICKKSGDRMQQFDEVVSYCEKNLGSYSLYRNRREATISYIRQLNEQGKFDEALGGVAGNGQYCIPFKGTAVLTTPFHSYSSGSPHNGLDFGMPTGREILACTSGQATYKTGGDFGNHVFLKADDGNLIIFAHMSKFQGSTRKVNKGEVIGYAGSTGNSTGSHLHFGITKNGESGLWNRNWNLAEDPTKYLNIPNVRNSTVQGA